MQIGPQRRPSALAMASYQQPVSSLPYLVRMAAFDAEELVPDERHGVLQGIHRAEQSSHG